MHYNYGQHTCTCKQTCIYMYMYEEAFVRTCTSNRYVHVHVCPYIMYLLYVYHCDRNDTHVHVLLLTSARQWIVPAVVAVDSASGAHDQLPAVSSEYCRGNVYRDMCIHVHIHEYTLSLLSIPI